MSSTTTQTKEEPEPLQQEVTVAAPPSSISDDKSKDNGVECKKTVGEELFLVHLNRFDKLERSPDDFDHTTNPKEVVETVPPAPAVETTTAPDAAEASATAVMVAAPDSTKKKRSTSIGEELWEVHCRRSQGLPPDYDEDNDETVKDATTAADSDKQNKAGGKKKKAVSAAGTNPAHPKRSNVAVEPREIHLRNRDVKVQAATASSKGH